MQLFALSAIVLSALGAVKAAAATPAPRDFIDEITHLITDINVVITLDTFTTNNVRCDRALTCIEDG
jgi:hypothetical protein